MDLGFKGKTALVTGAGSQVGFGKEIALLLAEEGIYAVALADLDLEGAEKTAQGVRDRGARSLALQADVTDNAAVKDMVAKALAEYGRIDILCNVAGGILHPDNQPLEDQDPVMWEKQLRLNLIGTMNVTQALLPHMRKNGYGVIVNIGSGSTAQYAMGVGMYAMSKYAIDLFTKQLAFVEGPNGIRANCVAPGPAPTNFLAARSGGKGAPSPEELMKEIEAVSRAFPLRRLCTARDVANATAFLASDVSGYITGQVLHVSGGSVM